MMNTPANNYNFGIIVKDRGGVFLTWTKVRLAVVAIFFFIIGIFLVVLLATPECICSLQDIQEADEEAFWGRCVDTAVLRNESFTCDTIPAKNYRLPAHLEPRHYNIELKVDFYDDNPDNFTYEGHVEMSLECVEETDVIMFHLGTQSITNITVMGSNYTISIRNQSYDSDTEIVKLSLDESIQTGDEIQLIIDFTSDAFSRGVLINSYWDNDTGLMENLVASHFQPHDARQAFPCFDEPIFKSFFNITLWRQADYTALSNMPRHRTEDMGDGWYKDYFEETPVPMPVYLVSFVISKYDYISDTADGGLTSKPMRYFADPESVQSGKLDYVKSVGGRLFDWLEVKLDEPFSLPKTDMVALHNFSSGGMENWGLIIYQQARLAMDPQEHHLKAEENIANTVAHELVHMWFGNLVTVKWWEDVWLQEGFASYYSKQALYNVLPEWDYEDRSIALDYISTTRADSSGSSHPLHNPVSTREEAIGVFSVISYVKGRCIVRMMRDVIGHDTFDQAMKNYIDKMKYKNVEPADLFSTIEQELETDERDIGTNFTEFMMTWTNQMGFPLITFHRENETSSKVEVTQTMFLRDKDIQIDEKYPSEYKYAWTVPLTYITAQDPSWQKPHRDWLIRNNRTLSLPSPLEPDDWLVANIQLVGYYHVNYDRLGWEAIISQLRSDHTVFPTLNRVHFLADAFTYITSDIPPVTLVDAYRLTEYLPNEMEYPPHKIFEHYIWFFDALLQDIPTYAYFRMYIHRWIEPHYKRLGWDDRDEDTMTTKVFRRMAIKLACTIEMEDCVREARIRYDQHEKLNTRKLDPDLANGIRCVAIQHGDEAEWELLLNKYLTGDDDGEDGYAALACTQKPWLISRYLELFLQPQEDMPTRVKTDLGEGLNAIARNPIARPLIWSLMLEQRWGDWMEAHRVPILETLSGFASTKDCLEKTVSILKRGEDNLSDDNKRLTEAIQRNIRWREENLDDLSKWLKEIVLPDVAA